MVWNKAGQFRYQLHVCFSPMFFKRLREEAFLWLSRNLLARKASPDRGDKWSNTAWDHRIYPAPNKKYRRKAKPKAKTSRAFLLRVLRSAPWDLLGPLAESTSLATGFGAVFLVLPGHPKDLCREPNGPATSNWRLLLPFKFPPR